MPHERAENAAFWSFWILLVYSFVRNLVAAAAKPLWYDELYTVAVANQSTWSGVLRTLSITKDGNPPGFYFMERPFSFLLANEHIAYRFVPIVGFACALACIFILTRTRVGSLRALTCAAALMLTPLLRPYAVEARPYSMVAACVAFALVCYQHASRIPWMIAMGAAFAAAQSMHYLAFFGFLPFALAELVMSLRIRKIRWSVWIAIGTGFVPIALFWPFLTGVRKFYGSHIWSPPSLFAVANLYSLLFRTFAPIALAIVALLAFVAVCTAPSRRTGTSRTEMASVASEHWIALTFLAVPIMVFLFCKIMHGVYTERYVLLTVLAIPLCISFALELVSDKTAAFVVVFLFAAVGLQEAFFWQTAVQEVRDFVSPAGSIEQIVDRVGQPVLPVMVSDGQDYFQLAHYAKNPDRFVFVVDPPEAVHFIGSDIIDLQLGTLRCCFPVHIDRFQQFEAEHASFLLYSGGGEFDWWPERLLNDGDSLQLLANDQNRRVYLVNLEPHSAPRILPVKARSR